MGEAPLIDQRALMVNVATVRARIARAGGEGRTRLVAVTKGFGPEAIRAASAAGADAIGENYAQELERKLIDLGAGLDIPVHFIGRIQRNKVHALASHVALWQSVDRVEVGAEIARRCPGAEVLAQVNLSGQPGRGGCDPRSIDELVEALRAAGLDVRGLMGIGPVGEPEASRAGFVFLAERANALGLTELSMGMSDDLEVAVECGSTMVRVGRSLFGSRPARSGT